MEYTILSVGIKNKEIYFYTSTAACENQDLSCLNLIKRVNDEKEAKDYCDLLNSGITT